MATFMKLLVTVALFFGCYFTAVALSRPSLSVVCTRTDTIYDTMNQMEYLRCVEWTNA